MKIDPKGSGDDMGDVQIRDGMIDIGDPTEEPAADEAAIPHRVVIEYRERGIPWMLVPPLLVLAAVLAVFGAKFLEPERHRPLALAPAQPSAPVAVAVAAEPTPVLAPIPSPVVPTEPAPEPAQAPAPPALPTVVESLPAPAPDPVPSNGGPAPADVPRAEGIGFDLKALEAEAKAPADPAVEPVANQNPAGGEIAREADRISPNAPADEDKPVELDPDLLPPDPRLARVRKEQRQVIARQQADVERAEFHAELRKICARSKLRSGPAIRELMERYEIKPELPQLKLAEQHLGKTGQAAGATKPIRIALLRKLGFGEAHILRDLIDNDLRYEDGGTRNGPRSQGEVAYYSALYLLSFPPNRPATSVRAASEPRADAGPRTPRGAAGFAPPR